ncbi:DNA polymerase V subunit UmuC, partial [Escherichia coli]|nr:DNA polymerase V subunit UmuC [Escherichia coli]
LYRYVVLVFSPETVGKGRGGIKWRPWFKKKELFRLGGRVFLSWKFGLYGDLGNRVVSTLEELSPRVEIYSIDEAFCDLTGVRNCRDLTDFGREIRATVLQRTHLTVGVGIAQTKTWPKMDNNRAKKVTA